MAISSAQITVLNQTHRPYKYRVNESRDMSRDHFAKNLKLVAGLRKEIERQHFFSLILIISNTVE